MEKQILTNESLKDRKQILEDSADKVEMFSFLKKFSSEELTQKKDATVFKNREYFKLAEEKKAIVSDFTARMKMVNAEIRLLVSEVSTGSEMVDEQVYLMADHDEGMMGYYSESGALVYQRPLLPEEQQTTIMRQIKDVS